MPSPSSTDAISGATSARSLLALGLAAVAAHAPSLRNGFVLDDTNLLADNPYLRTVSGLYVLLRSELFAAGAQPRVVPYYRPLSGFLYWVSFQLFGASAPAQHALNVALHTVVAWLLFEALRAHGVRTSVAFGATLIFAVHPATAEVVAYVGGRQDMLGWVVGLGATMLAGRVRSALGVAALGFGASLVGALCHEYFVSLFVLLAILAGWRDARPSPARALAALGGGAGAILALFALRSWLDLISFETRGSGPASLLTATVGVALRLAKDAVLPTDLAVDVTVAEVGVDLAILSVVGFAVVIGGSILMVRRWKPEMIGLTLAGLGAAALSAGLHAGVALKYGFISDRYAYALLVGLTMAAAGVVEAFASHRSASRPLAEPTFLRTMVASWGAPAVAVALVPLTWSRDASWRDERSLQEAMLADRPDDPESRFTAGMMAFAEGDIERAYVHCRAYAEARADSEKANLCIGSWLLVHRRPDEAAAHLRPYALSRPGMPTARRAFLASLFASRQFDEARQTVEAWSTTYAGASEIEEAKAALGTLADEPAPPQGDPAPPTDERALPKDEPTPPKDEPAPGKEEGSERP